MQRAEARDRPPVIGEAAHIAGDRLDALTETLPERAQPAEPSVRRTPSKAPVCHTVGTPGPHDATMEDTYLCPDCRAEHADPQDAVLGHIARCLTCVLLLEALTEEQALHAEILEIRVAA